MESKGQAMDWMLQDQLNPWSWLDQWRLLRWLLLSPAKAKAYRAAWGAQELARAVYWLVCTLAWFPCLVLALGLAAGTAACPEGPWSPTVYATVAAAALPGWLLSAGYGSVLGRALHGEVGVVRGAFSALVSGALIGIAYSLTYTMVRDMLCSMTWSSVLLVAHGLAQGVELALLLHVLKTTAGSRYRVLYWVAYGGGLLGAGALVGIMAGHLPGRLQGVTFSIVAPVGRDLDKGLQTGAPSLVLRLAFAALVASYAYMAWYSLLGGWWLAF